MFCILQIIFAQMLMDMTILPFGLLKSARDLSLYTCDGESPGHLNWLFQPW